MAAPNLRYAAGNSIATTLSNSVSNSTLTLPLSSVAGLTADGGILVIDRTNAAKKEYIYYTSVSGSSVICPSGGRGINSSATSHDIGASVEAVTEVSMFNNLIDALLEEHSQTGAHTVDTISEKTAGSGVTIDGLLIKDGAPQYDGWIPDADTWVYVSDTSFKVVGKDVTDKFTKGTKVSYDDGDVDFGVVASSEVDGDDTLVTLIENDDYAIANATLSASRYSYMDNPQGFPALFTIATRQKCHITTGGLMTIYGWGFKQGTGSVGAQAETFGVAFTTMPYIQVTSAGALATASGTPDSLDDFVTRSDSDWRYYLTALTGFSAGHDAQNASYNWAYSWQATGLV